MWTGRPGRQDTDAQGRLAGLSSLLCIYDGHIRKQSGGQDWGHEPAILAFEAGTEDSQVRAQPGIHSETLPQKYVEAGSVLHALIPAPGRHRLADARKFETNLVYTVSSRPGTATWRDHV